MKYGKKGRGERQQSGKKEGKGDGGIKGSRNKEGRGVGKTGE